MPLVTIPGLALRSTVIEVFEPAQTQDDGEIILDHFELGANEIREDYKVPSPYTSFRYLDKSLEEVTGEKERAHRSREPAKLLPHMQAEGEAGRKRLDELGPAIEAVDQQQRDEGIELPQERAQRWAEDVENLKGQDLPIDEAGTRLLKGRVNRTQKDMVVVTDDDYDDSGGGNASQSASSGKSQRSNKEDKAAEARKKAAQRSEASAAEQRRQHEG